MQLGEFLRVLFPIVVENIAVVAATFAYIEWKDGIK